MARVDLSQLSADARMRLVSPMILSTHEFADIVRENTTILHARPSPANSVSWNTEAIEALLANIPHYSNVLKRHNLIDPRWPTLETLVGATLGNRGYVSFDALLAMMTRVADAVAIEIQTNRASGDGPLIVCLVLNASELNKSSTWFAAYFWHHLPMFSACVDFVVSEVDDMHRIMHEFAAVSVNPCRGVCIVIDDVTYSGHQISNTLVGLTSHDTDVTVYLIVGAATRRAITRINSAVSKTGATIGHTSFQMINTPADILAPMASDEDTLFPGLPNDSTIPSVLFGDDIDHLCYSLSKMSLTRLEENAMLLYWRFMETDMPCIVLQHKLADSVSISSRVVSTLGMNRGELPMIPSSLVILGGRAIDFKTAFSGSRAFYSTLEWTYRGNPLSVIYEASDMLQLYARCIV